MTVDNLGRGRNRRTYLKTVGAGVALGLAGCSGNSGGGGNKLQKLGFSSYVRGGSWITAYVDAAKYYCKDNNIDLKVRPNRQSASKQVQDIRDFANKGYDGIIVGVWSTGAAKSAIDYAMKKGVPVMSTNADTASSKVPLYVGFSNYEGGKKSGQQMVKALKQEKSGKSEYHVLNVRGPQGNQSANQRSQGFVDVIKKAGQHRDRQDDQWGLRPRHRSEQGPTVRQREQQARRNLLREPLDGARRRRCVAKPQRALQEG